MSSSIDEDKFIEESRDIKNSEVMPISVDPKEAKDDQYRLRKEEEETRKATNEVEESREKLRLSEEEVVAPEAKMSDSKLDLDLTEDEEYQKDVLRLGAPRLGEQQITKAAEEQNAGKEEEQRLSLAAEERKREEDERRKEADLLKKQEEDDFWKQEGDGGSSSRRSSKPSIASLPAFQIHEHEHFVRPEQALNIEDIRKVATDVVDIQVTKSADGTLRVNVREDSDGDHRGLFVHSFKKESIAEKEGLLLVHDEILCVNGVDVEGRDLAQLVTALGASNGLTVSMRVRRHHMDLGAILYDGTLPDHSVIKPGEVLSSANLEEIGLPPLSKLHSLPAEVLEFDIDKNDDGGLHIVFHRAVEDGHHIDSLVLHSFEPDCAAAKQGLLQQGDELLALDGFELGRNLEGGDPNTAINSILARPDALLSRTVRVRVRRHHADLAAIHDSGS